MAEQTPLGAFKDHQPGLTSPARHGAAVTPADGVALATTPRALWIGTGGTLVFKDLAGTTVTLINVPDGFLLPVMCSTVESTSTTCASIVALW